MHAPRAVHAYTFFIVNLGPASLRVAKELDNHIHQCSGEHLGVLLVAYVPHRLPHAARVVHLAAEEAQG